MALQSSRYTGFLRLQLIILFIHFAHGGILSHRGPTAGNAISNKHARSADRTHGTMPGRWSAGVSGSTPAGHSHGSAFVGFPDDDGLAGDRPHGHVRQHKPNNSPKDRLEMRTDINQDDAFSPSSLPVENSAGTQRSNSSQPESGVTIPPPLSPSLPAPNTSLLSSPTMEEGERLARLEMLKITFLEQLGLDRPPNVTQPMPDVPDVVRNRLLLDGEQNDQPRRLRDEHRSQIIVFADEEETDCGHDVAKDACFKFDMSDQLGHSVVFSSHLWVYVTHTPEGASVFVGRPEHGSKRRILDSKKLYSREGWVELKISVDVFKWNRPHLYFEISTKPLQAGGNRTVARDFNHRPMLLLAMTGDGKAGRSRRSIGQCAASQTSCCMKDFVADFEEIGWDTWIIAPLSFNAHYCSGECGMASRHFLKDHTEMLALHMQYGEAEVDMSLCCVANDVSSLTVLYHDNNDVVHQRLMYVVVENCGCL